jgi:uncharacterized protein YjbI with pentapeptide repeats
MRNTSPWTHVKQGIGQARQGVWDSLGPARARVQDSWRSLALSYKLVFVAVGMGCLITFATQVFPQATWSIVVIGIGIVLVMLWKLPKRAAADITSGLKEQFEIENETRKTLATIIGGIALLGSLWFTWENFRVTQDLTRQGQITDRSTKAIVQLGDKDITVRIGGLYALEQVARISKDEHWPIMETLTAYIRKNIPRSPKEATSVGAEAPRPRTFAIDMEAVLTVLKRRSWRREQKGQCPNSPSTDLSEADLEEKGQCLNLRSTNLNHVNLEGAYLMRAQFASAHLRKAYFSNAKLQRADFYGAKLDGARFRKAVLEGVSFWRADLREADFSGANLEGANLQEADLRGADFSGANLEGANLQEALLEGAQYSGPQQFARVKTLYQAKMDESLRKEIEQKYPQRLSAPAVHQPAATARKVAKINYPKGGAKVGDKVCPEVTHTAATAGKVAEINYPTDGAEVGDKITVCGDIGPSQLNGHLWLAVEQEDLIWPKDPEVPVTGPNSEWTVTVYEEGTPSGGKFHLALYLVEDEGHQRIIEWLSIGNATDAFPGLRKIPTSTLLGRIRLHMNVSVWQTSSRFP